MAHGLLSGADGGRLFVRTVAAVLVIHRNVAGNVLALLTSRLRKKRSKGWTGGAVMADAPRIHLPERF
jgi:hypothetical protein